MAASEGSSGGASQLPKSEGTTFTISIRTKFPRRQLTLIGITICLNILLWSSIFVLVTSLYLIASDPDDGTNTAMVVLTLTSSLASIGYIVLHTIFSLKQRIWKHQRRHPSITKKTSYIAVRVAVTLCVLWLLTSGWDMIIVARQPVCLPKEPGLAGWQAGTTCAVGRAGIAIALIALITSCILFGMLATVRRPFEAHVFKHGYREPINPHPTPPVSRRPSPSRSASFTSDKFRGRASASASTHRSSPSNISNTDVETLDLNSASPPPSTIYAPSPIRSIGLGIFTSEAQPPPLPAAYIPPRSTSLEPHPPVFQPSTSYHHLPPPPRMSALVAPSGFVPLAVPVQYSASVWRAVHPTLPSPLGPAASRSHPHLPQTASGYNFSYRSRYSRSSVSLTRPHRLSTATPVGSVGWSSRSGSTGPGDEGRGSPSSGSGGLRKRASANEISYAILNGPAMPGTYHSMKHKVNHARHASAPDATTGAEHCDRRGRPWKSPSQSRGTPTGKRSTSLVRSSSAELLSKFSPESSPDNDINLRRELERELNSRLSLEKRHSVYVSRSESPSKHSDTQSGAADSSRTTVAGKMPQDPKALRRTTFDEVKNKPLPKIAIL